MENVELLRSVESGLINQNDCLKRERLCCCKSNDSRCTESASATMCESVFHVLRKWLLANKKTGYHWLKSFQCPARGFRKWLRKAYGSQRRPTNILRLHNGSRDRGFHLPLYHIFDTRHISCACMFNFKHGSRSDCKRVKMKTSETTPISKTRTFLKRLVAPCSNRMIKGLS